MNARTRGCYTVNFALSFEPVSLAAALAADAVAADALTAAHDADIAVFLDEHAAALAAIEAAEDPSQLEQMIAQMDQMATQVPPDFKPAIDLIRTKALARIDELKQSNGSQAEE